MPVLESITLCRGGTVTHSSTLNMLSSGCAATLSELDLELGLELRPTAAAALSELIALRRLTLKIDPQGAVSDECGPLNAAFGALAN
jgi:hypothetical protein